MRLSLKFCVKHFPLSSSPGFITQYLKGLASLQNHTLLTDLGQASDPSCITVSLSKIIGVGTLCHRTKQMRRVVCTETSKDDSQVHTEKNNIMVV
jgi:hypothetical protein